MPSTQDPFPGSHPDDHSGSSPVQHAIPAPGPSSAPGAGLHALGAPSEAGGSNVVSFAVEAAVDILAHQDDDLAGSSAAHASPSHLSDEDEARSSLDRDLLRRQLINDNTDVESDDDDDDDSDAHRGAGAARHPPARAPAASSSSISSAPPRGVGRAAGGAGARREAADRRDPDLDAWQPSFASASDARDDRHGAETEELLLRALDQIRARRTRRADRTIIDVPDIDDAPRGSSARTTAIRSGGPFTAPHAPARAAPSPAPAPAPRPPRPTDSDSNILTALAQIQSMLSAMHARIEALEMRSGASDAGAILDALRRRPSIARDPTPDGASVPATPASESKFRSAEARAAMVAWWGTRDANLADAALLRVWLDAEEEQDLPREIVEAVLTGKRMTFSDLQTSERVTPSSRLLNIGRVLTAATGFEWSGVVAEWIRHLDAYRWQPGAVNAFFAALNRMVLRATEQIDPSVCSLSGKALGDLLGNEVTRSNFGFVAGHAAAPFTTGTRSTYSGGRTDASKGSARSPETAGSASSSRSRFLGLREVLGRRMGEFIQKADDAGFNLLYLLNPDRIESSKRGDPKVQAAAAAVSNGTFSPEKVLGIQPAEWAEYKHKAALPKTQSH